MPTERMHAMGPRLRGTTVVTYTQPAGARIVLERRASPVVLANAGTYGASVPGSSIAEQAARIVSTERPHAMAPRLRGTTVVTCTQPASARIVFERPASPVVLANVTIAGKVASTTLSDYATGAHRAKTPRRYLAGP